MTMQIAGKSRQGQGEAVGKKKKNLKRRRKRLEELKKTNDAKYGGGLPTSY